MATGAPDGSYSDSSFENINLFNGRLNYTIPLVSPGGRGSSEAAMNFSLNLNWRRHDQYLYPDFLISKQPNYNPGYLYSRFVVYSPTYQCTAVGGNSYTWQRLTFMDSTGTEHELRDVLFDGEPRNHTAACATPVNIGTQFKSVDGSGMTFVSDSAIWNNPIYSYRHTEDLFDARKPMTGNLTLSNGTVHRIEDGVIVWTKDRNGNKTSYDYSLVNESGTPALNRPRKRVTRVIDSLNREIIIEYDVSDVAPFGLCDRITYNGFNGAPQVIRVSKKDFKDILRNGYSPLPAKQLFPPFNPLGDNAPVVTVPSAIWMPDGTSSYKFLYNPHIELARVETPTGAAVEYDYASGIPYPTSEGINNIACSSNPSFPAAEVYRRIVERRSYVGNSTPSSRTTYSRPETRIGSTGCNYQTTGFVDTENFDAANHRTGLQRHCFYGSAARSFSAGPLDYSPWKEGREYETKSFLADGETLSQRVLREWKNKNVSWAPDQDTAPANDTRPSRTIAIEFEGANSLAVLQANEYDENGDVDPLHYSHLNLRRSKSYHYKVLAQTDAQSADLAMIAAMYSESELAGVTENDYLYTYGYKSRGILGLVSENRVINPSNLNDVLAKSQFVYDEQDKYYSLLNVGTTVGYEAPAGTYAHLRGNVTTSRTWVKDDAVNPWREIHAQYDNFGNPRKAWDLSGDQTRFVETEYAAGYYYAYPTRTISPAPDPTGVRGTDQTSAVTMTYDFHTGRPLSVTDANGQTTSVEYDGKLRTKRVNPPAGGKIVEFDYGDTPGNLYLKQRRQVDGQNWAEVTTFLNSAGKAYKVQTKDRQGDVFVEIEYDDQGRLKRSTNPYRQGDLKFWSKPRYDVKGRVVESYAPALDGQTGPSIGTTESGISTVGGLVGHYTTVTDASGRKMRYLKNVYGQLVRVDEPVDGNDLGSLAEPTQPTSYKYDVNGRLTKIQQGQQKRFFMYDSLGRLIRTRQPEQDVNLALNTDGNPENDQWTAGYTYDIYGNVQTVTDAKGTVITNTYDKAGRATSVTYSDPNGTPSINYYYDGTGLGLSQPPQYSRGKLTKVSNGVSDSRYTAFDNLGRLQESQQVTDGQTYNFQYKYDPTGNLIETWYPSGRIVKSFFDAEGGLSSVSSKSAGDPFRNYASNFDYNAFGGLRAVKLGNGLWETAVLDDRRQLTQIGLGNSPSDTSAWKVDYEYGKLKDDGSVDAAKNSGLIAKQTVTLPAATFVQTYKYDELNRLEEARETAGSVTGTENWKQTFGYDQYGNRNARYQKMGTAILPINNHTLPQVDPAKNRFTTGQGYVYDFNGNLVTDSSNKGYTYDGNDKQTVVRDLNIPIGSDPDANVIGRYFYDGEGKRIKKVTNNETTVFVYDAGGALAAEYSSQTSSEPETSFITTDNVGSPRVITNWNGTVISRRDHMPYGEDLSSGVGARTESQKYSASGIQNVRQRYTGYEKDDESGLDFAQNRMYGNAHGRYTTVDPLLASAGLDNPQTLNRYAYVGNNPVSITDPSGLIWCMRNDMYGGHVNWNGGGSCASGERTLQSGEVECSGTGSSGCTINGTRVAAGTTILLGRNGESTIYSPAQASVQTEATAVSGSITQMATDPAASTADPGGGSGITELPREAPQTVGNILMQTVNSAGGTIAENNGSIALLEAINYPVAPTEHNTAGRLIGHTLSYAQSLAESWAAGALIAGGFGGELGGFVLDVSGVGIVIGVPVHVVSTAAIGTGVVVGTHGMFTLFNTSTNIYNQTMGSPALKGDPYSPSEVNRRQSQTRRDLKTGNLDPESDIPDQPPGQNIKGVHKADTTVHHSTGERNVGTNEEHSRVAKGSHGQKKR